MFRPEDSLHMIRALNLAERGRLNAHPNPLVGCVVARGPRVLAEGWHDRFGGDHAEVAALRRAGSRARGATLYVTLEPCSRWGKTPPCTDAVKAAGVRRVVIGARDPSLRGGGVAVLKRAGLRVDSGLHQREVLRQNAAFFKKVKTGLPYVVVKMAQTLDGKTASRAGASRWITGVRARSLGHRLRAQSDAVMVGGETVRRDNPGLTSHGRGPDPLRVVLSSSLQFSPRAAVFAQGAPTWVLTGDSSPAARKKSLERRGAQILSFRSTGGRIRLKEAFRALARRGVSRILVEGGGRTAAAVLEEKLADEAYVFLAPSFLGGVGAPTGVAGRGWPRPAAGPRLKDVGVNRLGDDVLIHGYF